jgi:predicted RNase H-like HicB family nuclease
METDITATISNLDLKVLTEFDSDYAVYVSRCLETGAVATGVTVEEAIKQIKSTLELDIRLAEEQGGLEALFFTRAEPQVWNRWYQAKAASPDDVQIIPLDIPAPAVKKRGPSSVTIATARKRTA